MRFTVDDLNSLESQLYLHDGHLRRFVFDRDSKGLHLEVECKEWMDCIYSIHYLGVVGFEMTSCDFYGPSDVILGFCVVPKEKSTFVPRYYAHAQKQGLAEWALKNPESVFETEIFFTSGDWLRVACTEICIETNPLPVRTVLDENISK